MDDKTEKINFLLLKLENLLVKQQGFEAEIHALREEVKQLRTGDYANLQTEHQIKEVPLPPQPTVIFPSKNTPIGTFPQKSQEQTSFSSKFKRENIGKSDFEKFIGENLISKIGILILVIGVAIGAKLAIEKGLVTPLTRIILGYLMGIGLMGLALKLKGKYESYSAVLLSGAIAILYFITYAAYSYYQLIPQVLTFGLMVIFTGFTVIAAIKYNQQVIAHIGLVGAYAIPFLLSDGTGNVGVLFTYMAIINGGILILSFTKNWKPLFYSSFALTWIIFLAWRLPLTEDVKYLNISMLFSGIYFLTFYITNLAYKVIKKEAFVIADVTVLLLNSFIFYGAGYYVLSLSAGNQEILGLFTLGNAIVHFVVSVIIYKRKLADRNLFYFILALVITFITMAVPVQLNGNWVTIFWAVEAAILFYLGRMKKISIYEKLSLPLIFLAFFSLVQDWANSLDTLFYANAYVPIKPFFNVGFLCAMIAILAFLAMFLTSRKVKHDEGEASKSSIAQILAYAVPTILILIVYCTFRIEMSIVFENLYQSTSINTNPGSKGYHLVFNENYKLFGHIFAHIYTLLFAAILTYLNLKKIKSKTLAKANVAINLLVVLAFLTHGLYILSELREAFIVQSNPYFISGKMNIAIRYVGIAFFALLIGACYELSKSALFTTKFKTAFNYLLYSSILWVLSSELLNILELNGLKTGYKLGLSILWGVYALLLISLGLWKNKKYLRIGAIILFGITLIKLFFYDISALDTISKTIVFVSLGILLLMISFLYNKYKHLVNDDENKI
jgi:uncharacterized membrane protein